NTVALALGYGRRANCCGRVGDDVGFDTYQVRAASVGRTARGATLAKSTDPDYAISSTQNHWTMGLPDSPRTSIVRQVDLVAWQKSGDQKPEVRFDRLYATEKDPLNFAERVSGGELAHSPPLISIYPNPFKDTANRQRPGDRDLPDTPRRIDGNELASGPRPR